MSLALIIFYGRRDSHEIGCVFLCKCVPVLTLDGCRLPKTQRMLESESLDYNLNSLLELRLTNLAKS